jgi:hypothetical protein
MSSKSNSCAARQFFIIHPGPKAVNEAFAAAGKDTGAAHKSALVIFVHQGYAIDKPT